MSLTKVWLGYVGLTDALKSGKEARAISAVRRLLALPDRSTLKTLRCSAFPTRDTLAG